MSTSRRTQPCALCSSPSVYTCPGCSVHTCSLPCSKTHKSRFACTGHRDQTSFVKLEDVGQGTWADDYRWLEEGRRKVAQWGEGISSSSTVDGRGENRNMRGRGRGKAGRYTGRPQRTKRDEFRFEMRKRGCEVDLMPEGMTRKKLNQSSWNPK